jgi:DNA-binding transcriptional regulator YiaG
MIVTAQDVKQARAQLGLSVSQLRDALRLSPFTGSRTIRRWERGEIPITGPAAVVIEAMLDGYTPQKYHPDELE